MTVEIKRNGDDKGRWSGSINGVEVTKGQRWLWQCLTKMMKYAKSQEL